MSTRQVRKVVQVIEDTYIEGHKAVPKPMRFVGAAAVFENPWPAKVFTENLRPEILAWAPILADLLVDPVIEAAGGRDKIEAYGKAAIVGTNCEVELALPSSIRFASAMRCGSLPAAPRSCPSPTGEAGQTAPS